MPSLMNILIMYHVHHLSTEMEGEDQQITPKSIPRDTNQAFPTHLS